MIAATALSLVLLVTDQPGAGKAAEVAKLFSVIEPFSKMPKLKVSIHEVSSEELGCEVGLTDAGSERLNTMSDEADLSSIEAIDRIASAIETKRPLPMTCKGQPPPKRLIDCNTPKAQAFLKDKQAEFGARYVVIVKDLDRYGGAGGKFPVITSASPATMAVHELMHQFGFADEYRFSTDCEADLYCTLENQEERAPSGYGSFPGFAFNVPRFNADERYSSNEGALDAHGSQIPWLDLLPRSTVIVTDRILGSPETVRFGLHRGVTCEKASVRADTWRPEQAENLMSSLKTHYIPKLYWGAIARSLGTKIVE